MAPWIMPAYFISGVGILAGGYFTYKYKPYCMLDSPQREIGMELFRKKLRNESLSNTELEQYQIFEWADKMDSIWRHRVLGLSMLVHLPMLFLLAISSNWAVEMPLYIVSSFLLFIGAIDVFTPGLALPFCISTLLDRKLEILDSFHKKINGVPLNNEDVRNINNSDKEIKWYSWQIKILFFGLGLHILASVLHGVLTLLNFK
jgi:sterol desaturase/sphingolipid hydroxylase (fatty acid hydroxylase superfamily)